MKFAGLAALAVGPLAFGAEQTCSCEIQKMFNKFAKISKDFESRGYYMLPYNDLFNFIDDEILPQAGITLNSEGYKWSDVDAQLESLSWEQHFSMVETELQKTEVQKVLNTTEIIKMWNATAVFYSDTKTYWNGTMLQRTNPEFDAWIWEFKDNEGFRVNMFSEAHAKAFHKFLNKFLNSFTGSNLHADITQIMSFLAKWAPTANEFKDFLDNKYGISVQHMHKKVKLDSKTPQGIIALTRTMRADAEREFEDALDDMFEGFARHHGWDEYAEQCIVQSCMDTVNEAVANGVAVGQTADEYCEEFMDMYHNEWDDVNQVHIDVCTRNSTTYVWDENDCHDARHDCYDQASEQTLTDWGKFEREWETELDEHFKELEEDEEAIDLLEANLEDFTDMFNEHGELEDVDIEKVVKFAQEFIKLKWFKDLLTIWAKMPKEMAKQFTEAKMVDVFVKFDAVLDDMARSGRSSAKPACICDGYPIGSGADIFRFNKVMPVCVAAGVVNLLN